jgi:hypothetical protein
VTRNLLIFLSIMSACAAAFCIALLCTGHVDQSVDVGRWAGGGIVTFAVVAYLLGNDDR